MAFEDLKENLREKMQSLSARIQESAAWTQLTERYYNLSPAAQKGVLAGIAAFFTLLLLLIPYTFYASSQDQVEDFEDKRSLIREVFRVNREASSLPPPPPSVTSGDLQSRAQTTLNNARLQPEQMVSVASFGSKFPGVPTSVEQAGIIVNLAKLNLNQIIDIGHELQVLHPMARMTGLEVKANAENDHYFDVTYKIVAFTPKPEPLPRPGASNRNRPRPSGRDEE